MKAAVIVAQSILRLSFVVLVLLGLGFWGGQMLSLVGVHMAVGGLFVLSLWTLATLAIATGVERSRATFAFIWGWVVLALGMTQQGLLVGNLHWIVRTIHLVVGMAAMPLAEILAKRLKASAALRQ